MKKIVITYENCEMVAKDLVENLFGKRLMIASYVAPNTRPMDLDIRVLPEVKIVAGFTLDKGRLSIPLTPRRSISWDLSKEKVRLTYRDDGSILLERDLTPETTICRLIMAF